MFHQNGDRFAPHAESGGFASPAQVAGQISSNLPPRTYGGAPTRTPFAHNSLLMNSDGGTPPQTSPPQQSNSAASQPEGQAYPAGTNSNGYQGAANAAVRPQGQQPHTSQEMPGSFAFQQQA